MFCRGFLEVIVASKQVVLLYFSIAKNKKTSRCQKFGLTTKKNEQKLLFNPVLVDRNCVRTRNPTRRF